MRLLDRFRSTATGPVAQRALSDLQGYFLQSYGTPDRELILQSFLSFAAEGNAGNGVVFGCILARLQMFSEATIQFRSLQDKSLFGTPSLGTLEVPWPNGQTGDLLARMEQDVSLAGNAFVRSVVGGDRLERLRPDLVTIVSELVTDSLGRQVREVVGYSYNAQAIDPHREVEVYDVDEVAHWAPIPDPMATFRGMSWLTPVVREIDADSAMTLHQQRFLDNGATPNLLVKYQRRLDAEDMDDIRARVGARYGGPENAGRTLLLDEGADATVIGATLAGMDFGNVRAGGESRIAMAAGVPPVLLGLQSGMRESQPADAFYGPAMRRFADLTMRPHWRGACAALSKLVDVPSGAQLWFDTSDIVALQPGEQDVASTTQVQAGTLNTLIIAGYTPDSAVAAVTAGDLSLLKHSGLSSVQMQSLTGGPPAAADPAPAGTSDAAKAGATP